MEKNFHDLLGRINGIAVIDVLGTIILAEILFRYIINKNSEYRKGLLRSFTYITVFFLALFTHLLLGIETPITKTLLA